MKREKMGRGTGGEEKEGKDGKKEWQGNGKWL
jgi:hypothetical protein